MYSLQKISGQKKIPKFNAITRLKQFSAVYSQILISIIHVVSIKGFQGDLFYAFAKSVILERKFLQMANLHAVIRETYLILLEKGNRKEAWEIIIKQELK
jgi:hypothetical protein